MTKLTEEQIDMIPEPIQRQIVHKHIIEGMTFREIAGELYYSRSSIRRKYRAAIKILNAKTAEGNANEK